MSEVIFEARGADRNFALTILRSAGFQPRPTLKRIEEEMGEDFDLKPYPFSSAVISYIQNNFFKEKLERKEIYPLPDFVCTSGDIFPCKRKKALLTTMLEYASTENPEKIAILFSMDRPGVTSYKEALISLVVNNPVNVWAAPGKWKLVFSDPELTLGKDRAFCVLPFSAFLEIEGLYE